MMHPMKQVIVIHGGDVFPTYEAYASYLKECKIDTIDYFKRRSDWKTTLSETLGDGYTVLLPQMPNKNNAKYLEWKNWFERMFPFLEDGMILIGHSLGAIFLAKYLSEERFPKKISATFLIAGPYDSDTAHPIVEFTLPDSLALFAQQGGDISLYHSKDDPVVPFSELSKYAAALPQAKANIFEDCKHFNQDSFPELVDDIKKV